MKLLTLEMSNGQEKIDGVVVTELGYLNQVRELIYVKLLEKHVRYDPFEFKLLFDLDEKQDFPNFANPLDVV